MSGLIATSFPTILIIDDREDNRLLLSSQLKPQDYTIIHAEDGLRGLDQARQQKPDLILLDVMMPTISGFDVCQQLKKDPLTQGIPIIMVTALRDVQYRVKGIESGADEFLSRPYDRAELLVRVRSLINLKNAREKLEEERNRLQRLYDVSRAITSARELDQMMIEIIIQTQDAVGAQSGNIFLIDEYNQVSSRIRFRDGIAEKVSDPINPEVMSRGLAGWLARHKRGVIVDDIHQDPRWVRLSDEMEPHGSVIGVPLSKLDRVIGVLFLTHPQANYFRTEHLSLLETIGAQMTTAIENAYLFSEINEQRHKLEAIYAQTSDAIITTDELWRLNKVNRAAVDLFQLNHHDVVGLSIRDVPELFALQPLFAQAAEKAITDELKSHNKILYASVSPILGVGYVAVLQDVTERRRAEEMKLAQERQEKDRVKNTFKRYMSEQLVDHILSKDPGLLDQQQRRRAVILFADLRGFTPMVVELEPGRAIPLLNEFFTEMTNLVYEFEGTVFDLVGDELMVGFNVPFDQKDASYRAIVTALMMQRRFEYLRQKWYRRVGTELGLGVGIDQGEVVVGNVGAETRMNFAMVGEAVNTAHRLVEMASDGQIIITATIHQAIQEYNFELLREIQFESIGEQLIRGKKVPQLLYRAQMKRGPLPEIDRTAFGGEGNR
ncbi:MAG: response regulator [Anaerolineae bacterium]|nr:response regulator [Anaerolineae bacterium]